MEENIFTKPATGELPTQPDEVPVYLMDGSRMSLGTGIKVRASDGEKFWTVDLSQLDKESLHRYTENNGGAEAVLLAVLRYRKEEPALDLTCNCLSSLRFKRGEHHHFTCPMYKKLGPPD